MLLPNLNMMMEPLDELIFITMNILKNHKAAGMDGVCGELMKYGSDELKSGITGVVKTIWKDERMSEDLDVAIYVLLRRKGDRTMCTNY